MLANRFRASSLVLAIAVATSVADDSARGEDWPQWRGADRANRSTETGLFTTWKADGPPLARVGNPKHGYDGNRSTPTIDGGKLYVVSSDGAIHCLNTADGETVWKREFSQWKGKMMSGWGFSESPLVDGDWVICTPGGSALLKLSGDGAKGVKAEEIYWLGSNEMQNKHGGMTFVDGYIYCGHGNGNGLPICVEMATGKIAWGPQRAAGSGETSTIYADGHIVFRREDGTVILAKATPESFTEVANFMPVHQDGKSWAHPVISNVTLYLREQNKLMAYKLRP